jgi:uncharacterized protein YyaL (SSP411 family)
VLFLIENSTESEAMVSLLESAPDDHRTAVVIRASQPDELSGRLIPLTHGRAAIENRPTAFVCRNQTCFPPVHTAADLAQLLEQK